MKFRFITAERAQYSVAQLCRCLGVSRSGYYAWTTRRPSRHAETDARLTAQLRLVHADSRQTYGRPRLCRALRARGIAVSGRRVARLMRAAGLRARGRRRFVVTTDSRHRWPIAPDRVRRRFTPRRVNQVWAADLTACRTQYGWCYLAVILDLASRRVVGWAVRDTPTLDLVITALRHALPRLRPPIRLIHHSDRGSISPALVFGPCWRSRHPRQHESPGQLLGQRGGRELLQQLQSGSSARSALARW